jgi:hypothetical protein
MKGAPLVSPLTRTQLAASAAVAAILLLCLPALASAQNFDNYLQAVNITGLDGPGQRGFDTSAYTNTGATSTSNRVQAGATNDLFTPVSSGAGVSDPDNCSLGGTIWYDSTVWFQFTPPWNGRLYVGVSSSAFRPVASVMPYNTGDNKLFTTDLGGGALAIRGSNCEVASEVTRTLQFFYNGGTDSAFGGQFVRGNVGYKLQIGSAQAVQGTNNGQGNFRLVFNYDPDRDGDGLYESQEDPRCVGSRGAPEDQGCPDADDDDIKDLDDQCRTVKGDRRYSGCPDGDRDGVPEKAAGLPGRDACPGENASSRDGVGGRNGCLDWRRMNVSTSGDTGYAVRKTLSGRRIGITVTKLGVHGVPSGSTVKLSCKGCGSRARKPKRGRVVFFSSKRKDRRAGAAKPRNFKPGSKIAIKISNRSKLYVTSYLSWVTTKRGWKASERCVPPGKRKPTRCGRVSLVR